MIELVLITCMLTMVSPYYDCNNDLYIFLDRDSSYVDYAMGRNTTRTLAFTDFGSPSEGSDVVMLGNLYNKTGIGKHDLHEYWTPLMHELEHVKCGCSWHNGHDKKD